MHLLCGELKNGVAGITYNSLVGGLYFSSSPLRRRNKPFGAALCRALSASAVTSCPLTEIVLFSFFDLSPLTILGRVLPEGCSRLFLLFERGSPATRLRLFVYAWG